MQKILKQIGIVLVYPFDAEILAVLAVHDPANGITRRRLGKIERQPNLQLVGNYGNTDRFADKLLYRRRQDKVTIKLLRHRSRRIGLRVITN